MSNHVVYATDENYWLPLYVSLHSLLSNNQSAQFNIHILTENVNAMFVDRSEALHDVHDGFELHFAEISEVDIGEVPTPKWFDRGIYYRLLIDSLLEDVDSTVLYLDCDTIVDESIAELFDTALDGNVAGAVPEVINKSLYIGAPVDKPFYNTGVLYIDLERWREHDIQQESMQFIRNEDDFRLPLQQILNNLLHRDDLWKTLPPGYNAMSRRIKGMEKWDVAFNPKIIYYTGQNKPWLYLTNRRYTDRWWQYLEETPYRDYSPPDKTVRKQMKSNTKDILRNIYQTFGQI